VHRLRRILLVLVGTLESLAARVLVADRWLSPRPALLLLRRRFDTGAPAASARPAVTVLRDLPLGTGGPGTDRFDLVLPRGDGPHPLVVWLHGGGWFFGSRRDVLSYVEHLADRGHAVATLDYPHTPESPYPAALRHLHAAVPLLLDRVAAHGVDPDGVVLAGSSAGANLAAQLAAALTSPGYAGRLGLDGGLPAERLRGLVLHGGIYDIAAMDDYPGFFGRLMRQAAWAYTADRGWATSARAREMSPLHQATDRFPPTFLTGGSLDPFTANQLAPMAARLRSLGVDLEVLELDAGAAGSGHDFQYDLTHPSSVRALERSVAFLDRVNGRNRTDDAVEPVPEPDGRP
jgi:acetyl esterase/lipase